MIFIFRYFGFVTHGTCRYDNFAMLDFSSTFEFRKNMDFVTGQRPGPQAAPSPVFFLTAKDLRTGGNDWRNIQRVVRQGFLEVTQRLAHLEQNPSLQPLHDVNCG